MAICLVCRFYGYTFEQVRELTIKEFKVLSDMMMKIVEMENPTPESEKPQQLTDLYLAGLVKKKPKGKNKKG